MRIISRIVLLIIFLPVIPVFSLQIESLHSVKFGISGVTYSYEQALGKQFTVNMEAGATLGFQRSPNSFKFPANPIFKNMLGKIDEQEFLERIFQNYQARELFARILNDTDQNGKRKTKKINTI